MSLRSKNFFIQFDDGKLIYKNHYTEVRKSYSFEQEDFTSIVSKFERVLQDIQKWSISQVKSQNYAEKKNGNMSKQFKKVIPKDIQVFSQLADSLNQSNYEGSQKNYKNQINSFRNSEKTQKEQQILQKQQTKTKKIISKNGPIYKIQQIMTNQKQRQNFNNYLQDCNQSQILKVRQFLAKQKFVEQQEQEETYFDQGQSPVQSENEKDIQIKRKPKLNLQQCWKNYIIKQKDIQYILGKEFINEINQHEINNIKNYQYKYPTSQDIFPSQKRVQLFKFLKILISKNQILEQKLQKKLLSQKIQESMRTQVKDLIRIQKQGSESQKNGIEVLCKLGSQLRQFLSLRKVGNNLEKIIEFYKDCSNWKNYKDYIHVENKNGKLKNIPQQIENPKGYLFENSTKIVSIIQVHKKLYLNKKRR